MRKTRKILLFTASMAIVMAVMLLTSHTVLAEGEFAGGTGTLDDPWLIETPEQLASIADAAYIGGHFKLIANIDLSEYLSEGGDGWNDGAGWEPVGTWVSPIDPGNPFTGSFDGDGHTISNLYINRDGTEGVGLFGYTNGAVIKNVRLENSDITGTGYVGSLVGYNKDGTINSSSSDFAEISGYSSIGGLIGQNQSGTIIDSNAAGNVTATFCSVGGLVGNNFFGEITNSYAQVDVQGDYMVGGLAGGNSYGSIESSYATGSVSDIAIPDPESEGYFGGLAGRNNDDATITDSYATGSVDGTNYVGGLTGSNEEGGTITNSYVIGNVNGNNYVGGLTGMNLDGGEIIESFAIADVTGVNYVGGLAGYNFLTDPEFDNPLIAGCYAKGTVEGTQHIGGLAGANGNGTITHAYAAGAVTGGSNVGGLVGSNDMTITASYYDSVTTGQSDTGKGEPETTEDMQLRSTYVNWNFLNIWGVAENEDYPVLRWQDGAPQSGFDVTAANPAYMGVEFQLSISQAKGEDGDALNGDVSVRVHSETQDEDVIESGINFSGGAAAVPVTLDTSGINDLRIYIDGVSYSNLLTVELLAVESIAVTNPPDKTTYYVGDTLNLTGLEVTGTYSGGFTAVLPITMDNISGFDSSAADTDQTVTVTIAGMTATFTVDIIESLYKSIAVSNPPDKTTYYVGESLELEGLKVIGILDDDSTEKLAITMANISGFDSSAADTGQVVTVTYQGRTATFTVDIIQVTYTVSYNANGGTGAPPTEANKAEGDIFTAASADSLTPPSGKQFVEWNTNADATGTGYAEGAEVTMSAANLTLYAIWEDIPYVPSGNANLSGLSLSAGTLSPAFSQAVTGYSASVGNSVSGIEVTPATADGNATVTVNGIGVADGSSGFVNLNIGINTITIVVTAENGSMKVYTIAVNRASSGGGGGGSGGGGGDNSGTQVPVPSPTSSVDSRGNITAVPKLDVKTGVASSSIDKSTLDKAFENLAESIDGKKTIVITIPEMKGAGAYELTLPASALSSTEANTQLEINTNIAVVTLPTNMLTQETAAGAENISLTIAQADVSGLDEETRDRIGDRPVISLSLKVDGVPYAWHNEKAPVTVSIPYTPTAQELADPEHITIWYIDGDGNVVEVPSGKYDPASGTVTFSTTHFSDFAVVYVAKTFEDLEGVAWARKPIEVLASKGILKGISEKEYAPQTNITRADFLYYLVRTLGVDAKLEGNFDDIRWDAYYYKEIGIAKKLGITNGTGNNEFSPDDSITRMDMMVLTERALRMLKKLDTQGKASDLEKFTDKSLIAAYATDSIASVVKEGLIIGSGDRINPLGNTTRAEAAVFLHRIYNKY